MRIESLEKLPACRREQTAEVLVEAFRHSPSAWCDLESAREEVATFLMPERIAFVAAENEIIVGWIGAIKHSAQMWELHPLAVRPHAQGNGIGRTLVETLEAQAKREDVSTIWLGTDDDFGGTNLFGGRNQSNYSGNGTTCVRSKSARSVGWIKSPFLL